MIYFAYGSNMCTGRLRARVPSATPVRVAKLLNHSLRFHKRSDKDGSGKADAYFTGERTDVIWGVIFDINPAEKSRLDKHEGLGSLLFAVVWYLYLTKSKRVQACYPQRGVPMTKQDNPWEVFDYEAVMFIETRDFSTTNLVASVPQYVRNAVTESALLHTRILADILLSRCPEPSEITLKKLLPDFSSPDIASLESLYGNNRTPDSPCWTLNKLLAHATYLRSDSYDYTPLINKLAPTILKLIDQVNTARPGRNHG